MKMTEHRSGIRVAAAGLGATLAMVAATLSWSTPAYAENIRQAQWYLDALQVPKAHEATTGTGVVVGVIDTTGVDASHPDLTGQVLPGTSFGVNSPNGWSSDAAAEHGTSMAGIIAAKGGSSTRALGIAPGAKILPVGISEGLKVDESVQAIRWLVDHGAKVISISYGGPRDPDPKEIAAVQYAASKDVVVVASAGNRGTAANRVDSPANIPGVVAVSGVGKNAELWTGSVTGPEVAIAAPAVDIVSPAPYAFAKSGYETGDGTSGAAPIVAGTVALIRSKFPKLDAANVINRLLATAKDQGTPGRDPQFGYGTVRVLDALTKDVPTVTANPLGSVASASASAASGSGPGSSDDGSFNLGWLALAVVVGIVVVAGTLAIVLRPRRRAAPAAAPPYPPVGGPPYPPVGGPPYPGTPGPPPYPYPGPPGAAPPYPAAPGSQPYPDQQSPYPPAPPYQGGPSGSSPYS